MQKSNLIELIKVLTPKEFKEFGEFIESRYFNNNENTLQLYNYIKKYYPQLNEKDIEKEKTYTAITGKKEYNDGFMRTAMFKLNKLAEEFFSITNTPQIDKDITYLNFLFNSKGADKLFEKKFKQVFDAFLKSQIKDKKYYYNLYQLQTLLLAFNSKKRAFLNKKDFHAQEEIDALDTLLTFYLLSALPEFRFFYNQAQVVNMKFEFNFLDEIISFLNRSNFHKNIPELNLFYNELMLLKEGDEKYFYAIKEIASEDIDNFNYRVKYNMMGLLANTAVTIYYNGKDKFLNERFEIYNIILEKRLYKKYEDSYFDDMLFRIIVSTGLQLNKTEWTASFINNYIGEINPKDRENALNLNQARLKFHEKQYDEALKNVNEIRNVSQIHYKTEIKILTLMILFEQSNYADAVTLIDGYRHFLYNDTILPENRKTRNYNFLKFTNELIKAKENPSAKIIYDLEFDIKNTPNTYEKEWLLEKTNELLKQVK